MGYEGWIPLYKLGKFEHNTPSGSLQIVDL